MVSRPSSPPVPEPDAIAALVPSGVLRAGINMANFLLVSDSSPDGTPRGLSPSLAAELAAALGVGVEYGTFDGPGEVVDALAADELDVGNIGADPARARAIAFTAPYCEIEATYLVPAGSPIETIGDVDRAGNRIASRRGAAYTLWLDRNITRAELVHTDTLEQSFQRFVSDDLEVLAGLRPRLLDDAEQVEGSRVLAGRFYVVEQAIGTPKVRPEAGLTYLQSFVRWAVVSGFVSSEIERHSVRGLSVASVPGA